MTVPTADQTPRRRFLVYHLPVIAYALGIIAVSAIPDLTALQVRTLVLDKVAHFLEYAVFAWLTFRSLSVLSRRMRLSWILLLCALFLSIFAVFDELFQSLVPGRHSDITDFMTDIGGALVVLGVLGWHRYRSQNVSN